MKHLNDYDLNFARQRFTRSGTPNRLALVLVVSNLAGWTDAHSDGWAYWAKPRQAAQRAIALIESRTNRENDEQERHDITDAEMLAAVRPIKAFLTKHKHLVTAEDREVILRAATAPTTPAGV